MEVLISMFVLAVGLLGVAALIPAGRARIVEAAKLDNAAMVGRAAFRDIQIRGYLKPARWTRNPLSTGGGAAFDPADTSGTPFTINNTVGGTTPSMQVAFAIDPLWRTTTDGQFNFNMPYYNASLPGGLFNPPPLHTIVPFQTGTNNLSEAHAAYDSIFRGSFDAITEENPTNRELPSVPRFDGTNTRRSFEGNYSWMATVVSDPSKPAISQDVTVSVVVFYKRVLVADPATSGPQGSFMSTVALFPTDPANDATQRFVRMTSGGEVVIDLQSGAKPVKPGQWIMLAGSRLDTLGNTLNYYRWYRVLSATPPDTSGTVPTQRITLVGQDWDINAGRTNVWLFDNIAGVYEKTLPLELE